MITDLELQKNVQKAINWEPAIQAAEIGVTAHAGVVTLSGSVDNYSKKKNIENAVKKVNGVKVIAENITIDYGYSAQKSDTEMAQNILTAWKENVEVPQDKVQVKIENGWVSLEGEVSWKFQKDATEDALKNLSGLKGINNLMKIKFNPTDILEKHQVEQALTRNWSINAEDIKVDVKESSLKLSGIVHSLYQKDEAERLAWNTPGVLSVENELAII